VTLAARADRVRRAPAGDRWRPGGRTLACINDLAPPPRPWKLRRKRPGSACSVRLPVDGRRSGSRRSTDHRHPRSPRLPARSRGDGGWTRDGAPKSRGWTLQREVRIDERGGPPGRLRPVRQPLALIRSPGGRWTSPTAERRLRQAPVQLAFCRTLRPFPWCLAESSHRTLSAAGCPWHPLLANLQPPARPTLIEEMLQRSPANSARGVASRFWGFEIGSVFRPPPMGTRFPGKHLELAELSALSGAVSSGAMGGNPATPIISRRADLATARLDSAWPFLRRSPSR